MNYQHPISIHIRRVNQEIHKMLVLGRLDHSSPLSSQRPCSVLYLTLDSNKHTDGNFSRMSSLSTIDPDVPSLKLRASILVSAKGVDGTGMCINWMDGMAEGAGCSIICRRST